MRQPSGKDRKICSPVSDGYNGLRLDLYLSRRFNYLSRTSWQREITAGKLKLNGEVVVNLKKLVRPGDLVEYDAGDIDEPEIDPDYKIIFENENFIGINKTGNLPVHPSGIFFHNTLLSLLEKRFGGKYYPVHRLDRETSGAILYAKNPVATSLVQKNFDRAGKEYIAIVFGDMPAGSFTVDMPIGPARSSLINKKREAYAEAGEQALTHFEQVYSSGSYSVVKAFPVTGRLHQIRIHLKYSGYPIIGDKMYGNDESVYLDFVNNGPKEDILERAGFGRCALHSSSFRFFEPFEEREITLKAEIPADMTMFIKSLKN